MTNFIVKAVWGGTSKSIPVSARTPQIALDKARRNKHCKEASVFIIYSRNLGGIPVLTGRRDS